MPRRPVALITGASLGLGAEFARLFAANGYDLVITARSAGRLQDVRREVEGLHGASVRVIVADLADPLAPKAIFDEVTAAGIEIDALVNNAGYGMYGFFHETKLESNMDMLQVNVNSLVHLTKLFIDGMVARGRGHILNVASTAAFQPGPLQPIYYATKAFVLSFTEAIGNELKGTGVTATALCPGPVPTGFQQRAGIERLSGLRIMMRTTPEAVVRAGFNGMIRGRAVVIPGVLNNIHVFLLRLFPRRMVTAVVRRVQTR
ncbi:MAG TPA: SDR family oxidoreductase [Candidatus Krumholzibacteria bacterium]|nr:SDR family oxidoreductase [Candidatus Krumholzibacteria bacterium]